MAYLEDHKAKIQNLKIALLSENQTQLSISANGGRSVLFTYPPSEESLYLEKLKDELDSNEFTFINIADLLVSFINQDSWDDFKSYYLDFKDTPHLVFKSEDPSPDLMDLIISEIKKVSENNKIPFLIRTGVLYGTGIDSHNIMEHDLVKKLEKPLVIGYPSKYIKDTDTLLFLNFKLASNYRCIVIE
ncbi:hypothetical protein [Aequorivita sp. KMM 9714]|uniref:hypothetical protein n=1 Tax=Aequorivita sp. KMM 9714 TaxID=2707173 RepID=UPI0013ED7086|nr:hypothetical protein [Aequorivita sp. KMM 9714]NGX85340.1 hypothetical protein [Aequorivita sp. KMM 9714]